jgi:putative membrane protein
MRERFETPLKALLIIGMALFLYSRLTNGSLYYYINQRFMVFTLFTVIGLVIVGLSYRFKRKGDEEVHDHDGSHAGHSHSHGLSWGGVALVLMPIVLGLAVPPQPLGASALANREINAGLTESSMPGIVGATANLPTTEKNILDWWRTFRTSQAVNEDERIIGQEARVLGFVYQDERYGEGHLMVVRYTVSCCVADASALALVVASPEASVLENDQWVEVSGVFAPGDLPGWKMPVLVAHSIAPVSVPDQPYLYP